MNDEMYVGSRLPVDAHSLHSMECGENTNRWDVESRTEPPAVAGGAAAVFVAAPATSVEQRKCMKLSYSAVARRTRDV